MRGTKRVCGAVVREMVQATAVSARPAGLPCGSCCLLRSLRLCGGLGERLGEALEPEVVVLTIPRNGCVGSGASSEALVVAEPATRGEADASVADNSLVSEHRERARWVVLSDYLDVDVPRLQPRGKVANRALRGRLVLSDDYVATRGRSVAREAQRERGGGAQAMPCRVQGLRQQNIKINVLTSNNLLPYLIRERSLLREGDGRSRGVGGESLDGRQGSLGWRKCGLLLGKGRRQRDIVGSCRCAGYEGAQGA